MATNTPDREYVSDALTPQRGTRKVAYRVYHETNAGMQRLGEYAYKFTADFHADTFAAKNNVRVVVVEVQVNWR